MRIDPVLKHYTDEDTAWQKEVVRMVNPVADWHSRAVYVRHGDEPDAEDYPVFLHHKPDLDFDGIFPSRKFPRGKPSSGGAGQNSPDPQQSSHGGSDSDAAAQQEKDRQGAGGGFGGAESRQEKGKAQETGALRKSLFLLQKAVEGQEEKAGGRWITVHPNGPENEGHPVYIVPSGDGSHTITAGAGGKLNGMRLTHVKSEEEYRRMGAERRKVRDEARKIKRGRDIAQRGADAFRQQQEAKSEAMAEGAQKQKEAEKAFIATVAKAQGVDEKTLLLPEGNSAGLPPETVSRIKKESGAEGLEKFVGKLRGQHHQASLSWAKEVAGRLKDVVLNAYADASRDALGDLSIADIADSATGDTGKGYQAELAQMAAANGLTPEGARAASRGISHQGFLERNDFDLAEASRREESVHRLHAGAAAARAEFKEAAEYLAREQGTGPAAVRMLDTAPKAGTLGEAVAMLQAAKRLESIQKQNRDFDRAVDGTEAGAVLPKAAVMVGKEMTDAEAKAAVADSLSQASMQKAMERIVGSTREIEAQSGSLQGHYSVGQTATFNAVSQLVDGTTVDPLLVDTLGASVTAHLIAAHWRKSLSESDYEGVKNALVDQHLATQEKIANDGVNAAESYLSDAAKIKTDVQPTDPLGVEAALCDHAEKVELLRRARAAVGVARGRLEAAANLNASLLRNKRGPVQVSLGASSSEDALQKAYALGLTDLSTFDPDTGAKTYEGQFTIHTDGSNKILELHPSGMRTLFPQSDPARQERAMRSASIKNGDKDEARWLPEGITRRPSSVYEIDPLQAHTIDHRLEIQPTAEESTMRGALREHIGALLAEGRDPFTVASDLLAASSAADLGLQGEALAKYAAALADVVPNFYDAAREKAKAAVSRDLAPDSPEYAAAVKEQTRLLTDATKPEFQSAFAAFRGQLREKLESYQGDFVDAQKKKGILTAEDAVLDKQHLPLDEAAQDSLFQAVAADPRTQSAFLPLAEVNKTSIRSFALEHILGVNPDKQEILSKITPLETQVYEKWNELRKSAGAGGIYSAIQADMKQRQADSASSSLFGGEDEEPQGGSSLATCDFTNPLSVIGAAKENAQALGYRQQMDPETGKLDYLELKPGQKFYAEGEGGRMVECAPRTEESIAKEARSRIKTQLRKHFTGEICGLTAVAESGFNPESVLTTSNRWDRYVRHMGGLNKATRAVQEVMAGHLAERFGNVYAQRTGKKFAVGKRPLTDTDAYALAVGDPEAAESRLRQKQSQYAQVGKNARGKFAAGSRKEKVENKESLEEEGPKLLGDSEKGERIVNTKRLTLGRGVEKALAGMMPYCPADRAVEVATNVSMSGKAINRQRATKLILENKRQGLNLGAGSGKTICAIGAFTEAYKAGKAKRALFVVPSNIVAQFGGEFTKFIDPAVGLRWNADASASGAERAESMSDPGLHMVVMTPESLREIVTKAVAEDLGVTSQEAVTRLAGMNQNEVDDAVHGAMEKRGQDFDFSMFDESHRLLGRQGKPDAHMARIGDSVARKTPYYIYATADPAKNDSTEIFSALSKLDPHRYNEDNKEAFYRKYNRGTLASGVALKAEMEPYFYTAAVDLGVSHERHTHTLPMTPAQTEQYQGVMTAYRAAQTAKQTGNRGALLAALEVLSPGAFPDGEPKGDKADRMAKSLGTLRETALNRAVNIHPQGAKLDWICGKGNTPGFIDQHRGEPTLVFARNLAAVHALKERLEAQGHRVATLTGAQSSDQKNKAMQAFSPSAGEASCDVLVSSDAGAAGANLQRGYHLINYDTPQTSCLHEQRIAREVRTGQANHVSVHDLVADCEYEKRSRRRLERKAALRELMTSPAEQVDDSGLAMRIKAGRVRKFLRSTAQSTQHLQRDA